jgi:hypothetical protein
MLIVHTENKTGSLGNVTLIASCECFRGNYCPCLEGRRVSHAEKQDIDTEGRKGARLGLG